MPRVVSTSAVVALVLATVWLFWPTALGGGTTYVATHGISMEPRFHTGDLAVLSPASSYAVGDVVAYRSDTLHTIVMHRIVSGDAHGFVTKGDNNHWFDEDHPTQDEILGRLFLRIPHGGQVLGALRSPGLLFSLAGGLLVVLGALHDPRGRRTVRWMRRRVPVFPMSTRGRARQIAMGAAAIVLVSTVGCAVLLTMSPTQVATHELQVAQRGTYSYSGDAVAGTTYPDGVLTTGDTVWNKLVKDVTVTLATAVKGPAATAVSGSVRLDVVVAGADGWSSVLTTGTTATLQNGTATASVRLDADAAAGLLRRHYEETGSQGGAATLTVTPVSEITGTVQGKTFTADPLPGLAFAADGMALRPASSDAAALAPKTATSVDVDEIAPRRIAVLSLSLPIEAARKLMGAVLLLSLVALGVGAWVGRIGRADVSGRFIARHADRILPVASFTPGPTVIDVSDAEALHRVAERFDTLVLHQEGEDEDVFAVRDVDATYRFVVPGGREARSRPPVPLSQPVADAVDATSPLPLITSAPQSPAGTDLWGRRFA